MGTSYWNQILTPTEPLDPNVVKALLGSESSFNINVKNRRIRKGDFARGLFQISDETRKIIADETGELFDHYLTLSAAEVGVPSMGAAACIRWLFHKKDQASRFLNRAASWEEAVSNYKGYLKRKSGSPLKHKGMKRFNELLSELRDGKL